MLIRSDIRKTKLEERSKSLKEELNKKIESRQKFLDNSRGDFVPETDLKDALGEELNNDWGADIAVRAALAAVSRVSEFVFYQVLDKLAQSALVVDDDVRCVMSEILGEDEREI